mmetsp:Transcript_20467/g.29184  ORF Transcript_20467/g.29184 Transcript_20467/m.29184 type:complete len:846 (+) Transcript_20467:121-2658(+)
MMPERFQALQELGFVWSINDQVDWEDRLEELIEYKKKYGDCLVPNKFAENPQLGTWVNKQRTHYKWMLEGRPNSMTVERARSLEEIGFVWSKRDLVDWYSRLEELKMYKQQKGDCNVPHKYSPNPQLGTWVMHQRAQYRKLREGKPSPMTEERVQALEEVGFTWSISNADNDWADRIEELKAFKAQHGNCLVPNKFNENPKLGAWVGKQRKQYKFFLEGKPCNLTDERVKALDALGFVWSLRSLVDWDARLYELKDYQERHGNCLVPQQYPENPQLGTWVSNQRKQYRLLKEGKPSPMTEDRVKKLEDLGFVWSIFSHDAHWDTKLEELKEYKFQFGDCLVPEDYKDNLNLGIWVKYQRIQYKLLREGRPSTMTSERIRELEKIGFVWFIPGEDKSPQQSNSTSSRVIHSNKHNAVQPSRDGNFGVKSHSPPMYAEKSQRDYGHSGRGRSESSSTRLPTVTIRRPQPQYALDPRLHQGLDEIQPWQRLWQRQRDHTGQSPSRSSRSHRGFEVAYNSPDIRGLQNPEHSVWEPLSHLDGQQPEAPVKLEPADESECSERSLLTISPNPADWEQLFEPFDGNDPDHTYRQIDGAVRSNGNSSYARLKVNTASQPFETRFPQPYSQATVVTCVPQGSYIVYTPNNSAQHPIVSPQSESHTYWASPSKKQSVAHQYEYHPCPSPPPLNFCRKLDFFDAGYHPHHTYATSRSQDIHYYYEDGTHNNKNSRRPPPAAELSKVSPSKKRDRGYVSNDDDGLGEAQLSSSSLHLGNNVGATSFGPSYKKTASLNRPVALVTPRAAATQHKRPPSSTSPNAQRCLQDDDRKQPAVAAADDSQAMLTKEKRASPW